MNLADKVALVTGASRGIGRAIAETLGNAGVKVAINYYGEGEAGNAEEVVKAIQSAGSDAIAFEANVADMQEVEEMVGAVISTYGHIDILVNNAGITRDALLMRMKEADWRAVIDINLTGVYYCTKAIIRSMMKQRQGKIINITSVVGQMGNPGQANYAAAKAGVIGFTKTMAKELASRNICVNGIAPGFIETAMTDVLPEKAKNELIKSIPLGKLGQTQDIANVVKFLASSESDYITGQIINVDGGMVMG